MKLVDSTPRITQFSYITIGRSFYNLYCKAVSEDIALNYLAHCCKFNLWHLKKKYINSLVKQVIQFLVLFCQKNSVIVNVSQNLWRQFFYKKNGEQIYSLTTKFFFRTFSNLFWSTKHEFKCKQTFMFREIPKNWLLVFNLSIQKEPIFWYLEGLKRWLDLS